MFSFNASPAYAALNHKSTEQLLNILSETGGDEEQRQLACVSLGKKPEDIHIIFDRLTDCFKEVSERVSRSAAVAINRLLLSINPSEDYKIRLLHSLQGLEVRQLWNTSEAFRGANFNSAVVSACFIKRFTAVNSYEISHACYLTEIIESPCEVIADALSRAFTDKDQEIRIDALKAAGVNKIEDASVVRGLMDVVLSNLDAETRQAAIKSIGNIGISTDECKTILVGQLTSDDEFVIVEVLVALPKIEKFLVDEEVLDAVRELEVKTSSNIIRQYLEAFKYHLDVATGRVVQDSAGGFLLP